MDILNEAQLKSVLEQIAEVVIEKVSLKVRKILEDYIKINVYGAQKKPNKVYYKGTGKPTFQFLRAWKWNPVQKTAYEISKELFHDWMDMEYNPDDYLHGSHVWGDWRENLADTLNKNGFTSRWNWKITRPYWNYFIQEMFNGGGLDKMFDSELKRFGFRRI